MNLQLKSGRWLACLMVLTMSSFGVSAQKDRTGEIDHCGTMDQHKKLMQQNPDYRINRERLEIRIQELTSGFLREKDLNGIVTISVVFHVIHNGDQIGTNPPSSEDNENLPDALLLAQLNQITDDFRRTNADAHETLDTFLHLVADVEIEFCLTSVDADGNYTSGINRYDINDTGWFPSGLSEDDVWTSDYINSNFKLNTIWDNKKFLNIWVVKKIQRINGLDTLDNTLGYAHFPGGPDARDGIVLRSTVVGALGNPNFTTGFPDSGIPNVFGYRQGRTGTHEVGHYLNLYHIWGDGDCTESDLVDDTPNADDPTGSSFDCSTFKNTCVDPITSAMSTDLPDMTQNYMDYTNGECKNLFTLGQKARMHAALLLSRPGLITSACAASPDNDLQSGAISLICDDEFGSLSGFTGTATSSDAPVSCHVPITAPGVWYQMSVGDALVTLGFCFSDFYPSVNVYEEDQNGDLQCVCTVITDVLCSAVFHPRVSFASNLGKTYYIYVSGQGGNSQFSIGATCDTQVALSTCYRDNDNDLYGDAASPMNVICDTCPTGYVSNNWDCNDNAVSFNPGAAEICNGLDNDCDGLVDGTERHVLDFDGDDDIIDVPAFTSLTTISHTLEFWAKAPTVGTGGLTTAERVGILFGNFNFGSEPDYNLEIDEAGKARIYWNGEFDIRGLTDLRDNEWHHLVFIRDKTANTFRCFVDGNLEFDHNTAGSDLGTTLAFNIGGDHRPDPPNFHGQIDEMRIWDYVREDAILIHATDQLTGNEADLRAYYTFEEGVAGGNNAGVISLPDLSGNGNNGTLQGFSLNGPSSNWVDDTITVKTTYYADVDGDGFGDPLSTTTACSVPADYVPDNTDCDDNDPDVYPGITYYADTDGDGFGDPLVSTIACLVPDGYVINNTDCDDDNPDVYPGITYYADTDGDGFGDPLSTTTACSVPAGYVTDNTDCDDNNHDVYPGALELCDGLLNNCLNKNSDFSIIGDASMSSPNCFELNPALMDQKGAIWNTSPISLSNSFTIDFELDLGDFSNAGDHGVVFVLQRSPDGVNAIGDGGGQIGYSGITPSIAVASYTFIRPGGFYDRKIEFWQNGIRSAIQGLNYSLNRAGSGPHEVRIQWNVLTQSLTVDWEKNGIDLSLTKDIIAENFGGDPNNILWGFTSATGSASYNHTVCNIVSSALSVPLDEADLDGDGLSICEGDCDDANPDVTLAIDDTPILADHYFAHDSITSMGSVATATSVVFQAANSISLDPGFDVALGGAFFAYLDPDCPTPPANPLLPDMATGQELSMPTNATSDLEKMQLRMHEGQSTTSITYSIQTSGISTLAIYDHKGALVKQLNDGNQMMAGDYIELLDTTTLPAGIYLVVLQTADQSVTKKLVLTKE